MTPAERLMRDVDPVLVAEARAARLRFALEIAALPEKRRCVSGTPVNHDGSCFECGDDNGEVARCTRWVDRRDAA